MKIIDKFKRAGSTVLGIAVLTSAILLGSCGQNESDVQSTKPPVQSSTITSSDITDSTIDSQQPQQPTKVKATELIDDLLSTKDFENVFQNTLVSLVQKEYPYHNVTAVSVDSLTIGENGKFVLNATLESNGVVTSTQVTYSGDTSVYKDFFAYGMDKETAKKSTMRLLGVSSVTQLTIGSTFERQVIETFEEKITQFDEQTQLIKGITAEELISKEIDSKPNEDTYVSVESIVNEAFAGIDFDADLMETVQKIFATRAPSNKLNKVYAIDFDISQDGHFTFYAENERNSTGKIFINSFAITGNTNQYKNFLNLTSDNRDGFINEILNDYSLNANSQIVKGSDTEETLKNALGTVIAAYNNEKTGLESVEKENIKADTIFSPKQFTQQEMDELGINDLNSFAEALLNNTRGEDFDQVQGWTMDDVVATYVGALSGQDITGESGFSILVITDKGIESHKIQLKRASNDGQNRYAMFLNDNPNTKYFGKDEDINYSENAIVYSKNGDLLLLHSNDNALMNNGYAYIEKTGSKEKPSIQF